MKFVNPFRYVTTRNYSFVDLSTENISYQIILYSLFEIDAELLSVTRFDATEKSGMIFMYEGRLF